MKHGKALKTAIIAAAAALRVAYPAAADRPHFDAYRNDGVITIDGKQDDWRGPLQEFGKDPVSIQVASDGEFLYMRLASSDPGMRMQLTRLGFTVWIDPKGGTKKVLGIRYPVFERGEEEGEGGRGGFGGFGRGGSGRSGGERRRPEGGEGEGREGSAEFTPPERVDILGPGKDDARSLTRDHLQGIEVAMAVDQGTVLYELKVPLAATADRPYAVAAKTGDTIGLGLETAKFERPSMGGHEGGMGGRGGGGFGGGGMGGHRGGGGRGGGESRGGFQPPKQLKEWATVTLK